MEDKNFIKGFNNGYFLKEHQPTLLDSLVKGISGDSPYLEGLREGAQQREHELTREKIKSSMQQEKRPQRDKDRER